jgi:hypothetical protein
MAGGPITPNVTLWKRERNSRDSQASNWLKHADTVTYGETLRSGNLVQYIVLKS